MLIASGKGKTKLSVLVADKIEQEILSAGWQPGAVVATEAELGDRYGVSRAILREAIGQIERRGIATMRRGHGGGLVVSAAARTATILALGTYLELANSDLGEMLEVRSILENLSVRLACERISEADVARLMEQADMLKRGPATLQEMSAPQTAIREMVADASGNALVSMLISTLDHSSLDIISFELGDLEALNDLTAESAKNKRALTEAIVNCDQPEAQRLAQQDADLQIAGLKKYLGGTRAQLHARPSSGSSLPPLKVGHSTALRISYDIRNERLEPGARLGAEPDLMAKYGVSRAAFREATRLLEAHSIVRTQRGSGGGLTVAVPDPSGVIESVIRYMAHMGLKSQVMWEVRESLDMGAVRLAARRVTEADKTRIQEAMRASEQAVGHDEILKHLVAAHQSLCDACHNTALSLLVRATLTGISRTYGREGVTEDRVRKLRESHVRLAEAVFSKNEGLARRTMLQHLNMIRTW